ncbi:MAG TPA: TIGR04255 family protein [Tepidisphaeraceae bacterium]|jgi:uncharacterized protein (TIGR04255 family)|nr:TIGR04255 family protein [Tepidisphaeraceae bacterium]
MAETFPKYDNPPVVETVLSAQFARLPKFRTAHAGCFWKSALDETWNSANDAPRLDDSFERFGDERVWGPPGGFRFSTGVEAQRTQIVRADATRMIQVQDSRFIYNWQKGQSIIYASYDSTRKEFGESYAKFKEFIKASDIGEIEENQWEVTYQNHLVKGELWDSPKDWRSIFPWFNFPASSLRPDFVLGRWAFVLPEDRGRLHVTVNFGRTSLTGPEAIILELTARGTASSQAGFSVLEGFEIGHAAIVWTFTKMTSDRAHIHWKMRD